MGLSSEREIIEEADDAMVKSEILLRLCYIVCTMAMQDLPLRRNTDETSYFFNIVRLTIGHGSLLMDWQNETMMRPYHVIYVSKDSQNVLIKLLGDAVGNFEIREPEEGLYFSELRWGNGGL